MDNLPVDVQTGLTSTPKRLPYGLEWDSEEGQHLYKLRKGSPCYWLREEPNLLRDNMPVIVQSLGNKVILADLGAGLTENSKTVIAALLQKQARQVLFVPIDVNPEISKLPGIIKERFPSGRVITKPFVGDFFDGLKYAESLPELNTGNNEKWEVLFGMFGVMIGSMRYNMGLKLKMAIGQILKKQSGMFVLSYSLASKGCEDVMSSFYKVPDKTFAPLEIYIQRLTRLYLSRLVDRFGADLDFSKFCGEFEWIKSQKVNQGQGKVDVSNIYIRSLAKQTVHLDKLNLEVNFEEGELIHLFDGEGYVLHYGKDEMEKMASECQLRMEHFFVSCDGAIGLAAYNTS